MIINIFIFLTAAASKPVYNGRSKAQHSSKNSFAQRNTSKQENKNNSSSEKVPDVKENAPKTTTETSPVVMEEAKTTVKATTVIDATEEIVIDDDEVNISLAEFNKFNFYFAVLAIFSWW